MVYASNYCSVIYTINFAMYTTPNLSFECNVRNEGELLLFSLEGKFSGQ